MKKLAILTFVALIGNLWAGQYTIGAEALFWKPSAGNFRFAIVSPNPAPADVIDRKIVSVSPDYHWGFRVYAGYIGSCCPFYGDLGWTRLRSTDTHTITNREGAVSLDVAGTFQPTLARARMTTAYDRVALRGGYVLCPTSCLAFTLSAGLRYVRLERNLDLIALSTPIPGVATDFASRSGRSLFEGGGLDLGVAGELILPCHFSFCAHLRGVAVIGSNRASTQILFPFIGVPEVVRHVGSHALCRPGMEARLELAAGYEWGCAYIRGYVGYEFDYYFAVFTEAVGPSIDDLQSGIGFGGPVAGISVQF